MRLAAGDAGLVDFAFRRTQGAEAAMTVARASAMVGFSATSNVEAARRFGLRAAGTMAHSYVEAFAREGEAFRAFAEDNPENAVLLVDTFDTHAGIGEAIKVITDLGLGDTAGIRLDSGDLAALSSDARRMLDEAGLTGTQIFASGGLDEFAVADLRLESVYKLVAYDGRPVMKLSTGKETAPGAKQVFRSAGGDVIALREERPPSGAEAVLVPVMRAGRRVHRGSIEDARRRFESDLNLLPTSARQLRDPVPPTVTVSAEAEALTTHVREELISRDHAPEV